MDRSDIKMSFYCLFWMLAIMSHRLWTLLLLLLLVYFYKQFRCHFLPFPKYLLRLSQILTTFTSEDSLYCKWEKSSSNYLKQRFWLSHILGKLRASLNPGIQTTSSEICPFSASRGFPSAWDLFSGSCFRAVTQSVAGGSKLILIARDPREYMYRVVPEKALGMSLNWLNLDSMSIHGQTIKAKVIGFSDG